MVFEVEARVVPSGAVDRTLSVYDGSADRSDAIKVTTLPYPLGYKLTFSMWSISDGDGTDMIINVLGKVETVHVEPYWTRCEILIEEPVGRDILITPVGPTKFWLYKAQLELGEAASDWVPSPDEFYAGSVISMNEHEVYIGTEVFEVDIANGAELLHIDEDGVVTNNMTVNNKIIAPNIAEKYTGASTVTLGDGSSSGNITLLPQQFGLVYPNHVLEGNGSGGVQVTPNASWDMYRYAFTRRSSIIPRRIVDNAAVHVLSMGYELNSTYLPLTTGELDSTLQADALIINCQKTETTTGGEYTVGPAAFTTKIENKALMSNGSTVYFVDSNQWDVFKLPFQVNTPLVFTALTPGSLTGVTTLAVERNGSYFTVDTPEISNKTVFDADALLINCQKTPVTEQYTRTVSSFSTSSTLMNQVATGVNGYIIVEPNNNWDIYRYDLGGTKKIRIDSFTETSYPSGVPKLFFEQNGSYYWVRNDAITSGTIFEADALLINCFKDWVPTSSSATKTFNPATDGPSDSNFDSTWMTNSYFGYDASTQQYTWMTNSDWNVANYDLQAWRRIRIDNLVIDSDFDKNLIYSVGARYYGDTYGPITTNMIGSVLSPTVGDLKINYSKQLQKYPLKSITYTQVQTRNNYTISNVTYTVFDYDNLNRTYSIDSAEYITNPVIVIDRQFSIERFEYADGSSDVGVSSYKTISDFANAVSNRVLTNDLVVNMNSDIYGGSWIGGISGIGGITINGNGTNKNTMNSNLSFYNMNVPITFNRVTFNGSIGLNACKYVAFNDCVLNGNGGSVALYLGKGTTCSISGGGIYNAGVLVAADTGAKLLTEGIGGKGSTTAFLSADKSIILMNGTRPLGNVNLTSCLTSPADISQMDTYEGNANPDHESTSVDLTPIAASNSRTYYEGTWYSASDSNVRQGFMSMGNSNKVQSGCMWFPTSALSNLSIKSATLTLTRVAGKGVAADVEIGLWGTKATGPDAGQFATDGAVSYGTIGTIGNGETKEFPIPLTAINALKIGSVIKGLMLQVSDHTLKNGKGYSANYAVFYGAGTNYAPVLKIVGQ